jgi:hypothetical protein
MTFVPVPFLISVITSLELIPPTMKKREAGKMGRWEKDRSRERMNFFIVFGRELVIMTGCYENR